MIDTVIKSFLKLADYLKERGFLFFAGLIYRFCSLFKYYLVYSSMGLSDIYDEKDQYKKGVKLFKKLTDKYPNNGRFAFQLAYFYSLNDNYNKAIEIYRKLLDKTLILNRDIDYKLVGNLIDSYNEKKNYEKSLELIEMFLNDKKVKNINISAYYNAGNTFLNIEDYQKAIEYYNRALSLKESADVFFNKALCLREVARYKNSLKFFLKAESLEQNPSLKGKVQNSIGHTYYLLKEYDKALEYFNKSINNGFEKAKENYIELTKELKEKNN